MIPDITNEAATAGGDGSCWPTRDHELLLRAALLDGPEAEHAWNAWQQQVDLDEIDDGSFRLLPLLHSNLVRHGIESPLLRRFKGVHRQAWFKNQVLFRQLAELVGALEAGGISTLLLKGVALSVAAYQDEAVRPMADGDVLVHTSDARAAFDVFTAHGWLPQPAPTIWPARHRPSWPFRRDAGQEIDLHWHLLADCLDDESDADFWAGARTIELHGVRTRVLSDSDQLLHVIVHGLVRNAVPPVRWAADASTVIVHAGTSLDWERLFRLSRDRRLAWTVSRALQYLHQRLSVPIPSHALDRFAEYRPAIPERLEHWSKTEPGATRLACRLFLSYTRSSRSARERRHLAGFIAYLENFWNVDGVWPLTKLIARKVCETRAHAAERTHAAASVGSHTQVDGERGARGVAPREVASRELHAPVRS